jgi:hypothetical protein
MKAQILSGSMRNLAHTSLAQSDQAIEKSSWMSKYHPRLPSPLRNRGTALMRRARPECADWNRAPRATIASEEPRKHHV